ncbi:MAG: glycosyltransferase [Planctomycetaceae bacterium]|nr:glycosyltransferase [Planctomycetaceae bacterium]
MPQGDPRWLAHQNLRRCRLIAEILGGLGFIVDVGDARDARLAADHAYDLVLSDRGNPDAQYRLKAGGRTVFIGTTIEHSLHNRNLLRRHELLRQRRGQSIELRRRYEESLPLVAAADAILCVGNRRAAQTWRSRFAGPIYEFNNHPACELLPDSGAKDFAAARNHSLFFASRSQVQKGLDLLLEVFPKHPGLHLYVCSKFAQEPDFCDCYRRELFESPNIHPIGWVEVLSGRFSQLIETCGAVILPTCSEGQAGSVVQCMHAGLTPMVTREAGIDVEDFGVLLADDRLETLERAVLDFAQQPGDWHRSRSLLTRQVAAEKYSEAAFVRRWTDVLAEVTGSRLARSSTTGVIRSDAA